MIRLRHPYYNLRVRFAQCETTQTEVARKVGLSPSAMTDRMNGKQPFDAREMLAIADVLGIRKEEFGSYFFPTGGFGSFESKEDEVQP